MQQPTLLRHSDIEAYRTWRRRRVGPAYFRGYPTWMWQTALKRRTATSR